MSSKHERPPRRKKSRKQRERIDITWVRLPMSVVKARAGIIPPEEIDTCPPPDDLTVAQQLAWYRGLPVPLKSRVERVGSRKDR